MLSVFQFFSYANNIMNINNKVGLTNFGNTCFMNASIQLLLSASTMNLYMINTTELDISSNKKYIQTFKDYYNPMTKTLGPKILYTMYKQLNTRYCGNTQEDAHEFITYTLDNILDNVKTLKNDKYTIAMERYMSVTLLQHVQYKKNQDVNSNKIIKENMLSFPMNYNVKTLNDCYNLFKIEENDDFTLSLNIKTFPKYLFIGLKRFVFNGRHFTKNNIEIDIPLITTDFHPNINYKLKAFIMHVGNYTNGHYYAYSLKKIKSEYKWFCLNDTSVNEVPIEKINNELKKAYILLYSHKSRNN